MVLLHTTIHESINVYNKYFYRDEPIGKRFADAWLWDQKMTITMIDLVGNPVYKLDYKVVNTFKKLLPNLIVYSRHSLVWPPRE